MILRSRRTSYLFCTGHSTPNWRQTQQKNLVLGDMELSSVPKVEEQMANIPLLLVIELTQRTTLGKGNDARVLRTRTEIQTILRRKKMMTTRTLRILKVWRT